MFCKNLGRAPPPKKKSFNHMRVYYRHILDVIIVNYFIEIRLGFWNQIYVVVFFISQQVEMKVPRLWENKEGIGKISFSCVSLYIKYK